MAARGQVELLIVMPAMVLSPFFFLGLHFRPALVCVALTIAAFADSAFVFELPVTVLLRSCVFLVATAAMSAMAAWQIERQSRRSFLDGRLIAQLAEHDALTGAKNRRVFDEQLIRLWQQAIDDRRPLAILLIDVDHFKDYNDRYGHQAGDAALQQVAKAVQAQIHRPLDMLSRYGGEEFAALPDDVDAAHARDIAERIRLAVSALSIEHRGSRVARVVTISIGVAAVQPSADRGALGALQLADEALYTAKVGGREQHSSRGRVGLQRPANGYLRAAIFRELRSARRPEGLFVAMAANPDAEMWARHSFCAKSAHPTDAPGEITRPLRGLALRRIGVSTSTRCVSRLRAQRATRVRQLGVCGGARSGAVAELSNYPTTTG